MFKSLKGQLTLVILCILLMTILSISILSKWFITREFETYIQKQEIARSENIVLDLGNQYNTFTRSWDMTFLHTVGMYSLYDGYILKIYNGEGTLLWDAENHDSALCGQIMDEISERMASAKKQGAFVTHTYPIFRGEKQVGSVSISYFGPFFFTENDYLFIKSLDFIFIAIGLASILITLMAGHLIAKRIAQPIALSAFAATQIAKGQYDIKLETNTSATELKILAIAVNELSKELETQDLLRKRLTSDIAHELRTPLSAVASHLEAMIEGIWEPTPERLKRCHDEVNRLSVLVSDLGKLAKIEDGNIQLNKSSMDLLEVSQMVIQNFESKALLKGQRIDLKGEKLLIEADREKIVQVIVNLLSNALNYTSEGGIVQLEIFEQDHKALLRISDNGIGIDSSEMPFVFERFYRTDKSRSRKTGGTGIGLTIAKSFVEAHGGTIEVSSIVNEGSVFTVSLPM